MQTQIHEIWDDFDFNLVIKDQILNINIKQKATLNVFTAQYSFENLPNKIKTVYGTLRAFLEEVQFVVSEKNHDRLIINENGQIVFGILFTKAGKQILEFEVLITKLQIVELGNKQFMSLLRNFQTQKSKNENSFQKINLALRELEKYGLKLLNSLNQNHFQYTNLAQKQSSLIIDLKKRIQALQTKQKEQTKVEILFEDVNEIKGYLQNIEERLKNCVQKKSNKILQEKNQNIKQKLNHIGKDMLTDMGYEEAQIDGFKCQFEMKNNQIQINLMNRRNAQQFSINLNQSYLKNIPFIENALTIFQEIIHIIRTQTIKERMKISQNGRLTIKFVFLIQNVSRFFEETFEAKRIFCNQIQRLQNLIQIRTQQIQQSIKEKALSQMQKNLREWNLNLFEEHLLTHKKQDDLISKLGIQLKDYHRLQTQENTKTVIQLIKINQDIKNFKFQFSENNRKNLEEHKKLNKIIQDNFVKIGNQTQELSQELSNFISKFTESMEKLSDDVYIYADKIKSNLLVSPKLFRQKLKMSSILQSKQDIQKLFTLCLPLKIKELKLLFKASEHNFSAFQFHNRCNGIQHTLTLIKTNYDKIIGGYTQCAWRPARAVYANDYDGSSFLFSLTNLQKLKNTDTQSAIFNKGNHGPTFSRGHDLYIANQSTINDSCYANIGYTYKNDDYYPYEKPQSWKNFTGGDSNKFSTKQYQVYAVILQ